MGDFNVYAEVQGADGVTAQGDKTIIAAPGASKKLHIVAMVITVYSALSTALVKVEDGVNGTVLAIVDGNALGTHPFYWGERGYILTANTLLNLTNITADCSVWCTAVGYIESRV